MAANDVLILLPGIMGSVLQQHGKDVWKLSLEALARAALHGRDLRSLALTEDSETRETLDDGVLATAPVRTIRILPGVWKVDGYTRIEEELVSRLEVPQANQIAFAYDWRRSNRAAARRLQRLVAALRKDPGVGRVYVVGHSMGGLVARYYAEVLDGWREVEAVFTIGTPHRGAVKALSILTAGFAAKLGPIVLADLTATLRTFTSLYQLLPTYPCIDVGGRLLRASEVELSGLDRDRVLDGLAFHREIDRAAEAHLQDPAYRERVRVVPIVGIGQPTLQAARFQEDGALTFLRTHPWGEGDGDGTVPRVSGTPVELSDEHREVFVAGTHGSLQNMAATLDQLVGFVTTGRLGQAQYRALPAARLSLELEDAFYADEAVSFRVRPTREPASLTATLEREGGAAVVARLTRAGDGWHGPAPLRGLDPGAYRLRIEGLGVEPIEDVFSVLALSRPGVDRPAEGRRGPRDRGVETALAKGERTRGRGGAPSIEVLLPDAAETREREAPGEVTRWPGLEADRVVPGETILVTVSLTALRTPTTAGGPISTAAQELTVQLASPYVEFEAGPLGRGVARLTVDPAKDSATALAVRVSSAAAAVGEIEISATFLEGSRPCGSARRFFAVERAPAAAGSPAPRAIPNAFESSGVVLSGGGEPAITLEVRSRGPMALELFLHLRGDLRALPDLPDDLSGEVELQQDPASFVTALFPMIEGRARGRHLPLLRGAGARLWRATPASFRQAYAAIAGRIPPAELTIQILTQDPFVPWELMLLPPAGASADHQFLGVRHPVARWPFRRAGQLRPSFGPARIAALVPHYPPSRELGFAKAEGALLAGAPFGAYCLKPVTVSSTLSLLAGQRAPPPVGILHYAGHGVFDSTSTEAARIQLEDGELYALEIDTPENVLGSEGPLVFMNACQIGRSGALLAGMGGWAESWLARGYSGFVAPLWSVADDKAYLVTDQFYRLVLDHVPVAEALRRIRAEHGGTSQTYLSYVFYGDVGARFA